MRTGKRAIAIALLALGWGGPAPAEEVSGRARLVDGDTIEVAGVRVRLHGIDAPETGQSCEGRDGRPFACGKAATDALAALIGDDPVICDGHERDAYGRLIAVCRTPGGELNRQMVLDGMAVPFTRYSEDYLAEGIEAQKAGRGIYAGRFEQPEDFRARRWEAGALDCPPECPIKGNISGNGRIYHVPWSRWYDRTSINPARGEQCFCSEAEALEAGWRAPRR